MQLNDDPTRLRHILEAAQEAIGYTEGVSFEAFQGNRLLQHAIVRCLEIVGEASARLSTELRSSNPHIPWTDIIGMRNRIVHAYHDIDVDIIWQTAVDDLPRLIPEIEAIHSRLFDSR